MTALLRALGVVVACLAGCAHAPKPVPAAPPPTLPDARVRAPRPPPPAEWYWQAVDPEYRGTPRRALALPVTEAAIVKHDGAAKVWSELAPEARERVRKDGLVVVGSETETLAKNAASFSAFYNELAERKVPQLVTVDALFAATRFALESALAQVEDELAPVVDTLLQRLETRLNSEKSGVGATLGEAYRLARGVVIVARVLAGADAKATVPADLASVIAAEKALIEAHAVVATSPVLGVTIDYTRFVTPSAAARPGTYRALAWLGTAPFALAARAEHPGAPLDVAQTRASTRAAMLLARLCDADTDATLNALYTRISRYIAFVWGPSDDLTLFDLDEIGTKAGVDLTKPEHILDVAKVDKVRAGARARSAATIYDGAGGVGRTARVFGGHASPDAVALSALLGPAVGTAQQEAPPSLQRDGMRVVPSTLDFAAWVGVPNARAVLHETHADAFDELAPALAKIELARKDLDADDVYHSSVYGSLLAAVTSMTSRMNEPKELAFDRLRIEKLLAAWTTIRHVDAPFARAKPVARTNAAAPAGSTVPVYVEGAPAAIAELVGAVRQARRGLDAIAGLKTSPLDDAEELLRIALKVAEHEPAKDEPVVDASSLPARIAKLEDDFGDPGPITAVIAADPPSRRVLVSATGRIEPLLVLVRDPGRDEPVLAVGPHLAHHELVTDAGEIPTDAAWRTKAGTTARAPWVAAFRFLPAGRVPP